MYCLYITETLLYTYLKSPSIYYKLGTLLKYLFAPILFQAIIFCPLNQLCWNIVGLLVYSYKYQSKLALSLKDYWEKKSTIIQFQQKKKYWYSHCFNAWYGSDVYIQHCVLYECIETPLIQYND